MRIGKLLAVGDSVAIVVAKPNLRLLGWMKGDQLVQEVHDDKLILRNVRPRKIQLQHTRKEFGDSISR